MRLRPPIHRHAVSALVPVLLLLTGAAAPAQPRGDAFPLRLGAPQVVGREAALGRVVDSELGADGTVYVVDFDNARVVAFSPEGRVLWRSGRKGRGPGEFQMPYRVGASPDGRVFVYDLGTGEMTRLSARDGGYEGRWRLPFSFDQVDQVVPLSAAQLAVSGTTRGDLRARPRGVHRFAVGERELKYAGSFGPLPAARDTLVQQMWGAGMLSRAANGDLLFSRAIPYEVYRFDASGRQKAMIRPPFGTRGTPDDAFRVVRSGRAVTLENAAADVERPGIAHELPGGRTLVLRSARERAWLDLFAADGRFLGSRGIPVSWGTVVGYDTSRNVLWLRGEEELEPVLYRVPVVGAR